MNSWLLEHSKNPKHSVSQLPMKTDEFEWYGEEDDDEYEPVSGQSLVELS